MQYAVVQILQVAVNIIPAADFWAVASSESMLVLCSFSKGAIAELSDDMTIDFIYVVASSKSIKGAEFCDGTIFESLEVDPSCISGVPECFATPEWAGAHIACIRSVYCS